MQTKLHLAWAETSLSRMLEAFEREILEAPEDEIMEAARALGMKPDMKGSAAFIDLQYLFGLRSADLGSMHSWSSALDQRMAAERRVDPDGESATSRELKRRWQAKDSDSE